MRLYQVITSILGIGGFALSVYNFVVQRLYNTPKFRMVAEHATIRGVECYDEEGAIAGFPYLVLRRHASLLHVRLTVFNRSSFDNSVASIALRIASDWEWLPTHTQLIPITSTDDPKPIGTKYPVSPATVIIPHADRWEKKLPCYIAKGSHEVGSLYFISGKLPNSSSNWKGMLIVNDSFGRKQRCKVTFCASLNTKPNS